MADTVPAASGSDGDDGAELRCALAAAWHVMRARRVREFHHVVDVVDSLRDVPRSFKARTWTRLRMGLRAAVVMQMLRDGQSGDVISDAMRRYFPPGSSQKEQPDVAEAQEHFVRLVSELVQNPRKRKWYLQRWAPHTYGRKLVTNLKSLLFELLLRIDSALPPPRPRQDAGPDP
ncbi:TERF1-interacting nuclear factor 2 [Melopsittacus undulatus]|uniref:TERF1-interacting nuclear factor 2 n=1 Tax=Melopsittacus undulatus TaxID=13146 RepID=UPI00146BEDC3|nr:TERF1-interacting nuclear factor 2 [Melopsittacus undulatus]